MTEVATSKTPQPRTMDVSIAHFKVCALSWNDELLPFRHPTNRMLATLGTQRGHFTKDHQLRQPPCHNTQQTSSFGNWCQVAGQSEPNLTSFPRAQSANMSAMANDNEGSVASVAYNHSESGSVIVSPSKKRKTRHASGQSAHPRDNNQVDDIRGSVHGDRQNLREHTAACDCGRTTPTPSLRTNSRLSRPQRPSPTAHQPEGQDRAS